MSAPLSFSITRHAHLPGVRLSLTGDFTNRPFADDATAADAAELIAKGRPYVLNRESFPALPAYRRLSR